MATSQKNSDTQNQLRVAQATIRIAHLLNKTEGIEAAIEKLMNEFIDLV